MSVLSIPRREISSFCRRWKIAELALFGSVLRSDFSPKSDIDVLVTFASNEHWSLFDLARMKEELEKIFGREVDLVEKTAVKKSKNWIRRKAILESAEVVYAAR